MALPGQTITLRDGGLGLAVANPTKFLFVGPSSSGTANQITTHSRSQAVRSALGEGLVVEAACRALDVAGGSVDVLKTAASVAAANTDITKVGGHTGPTVTVAGNAVLPFDVVLTVRAGGTLGAGTFDYSLDGGKTRSEILTIPGGGSYAIPNTGLTLTFPAGTYNAGDQYTFATTPAMYNATDLTNAWAAVLKSSSEWPIIVFCGQAADAAHAGSATMPPHAGSPCSTRSPSSGSGSTEGVGGDERPERPIRRGVRPADETAGENRSVPLCKGQDSGRDKARAPLAHPRLGALGAIPEARCRTTRVADRARAGS